MDAAGGAGLRLPYCATLALQVKMQDCLLVPCIFKKTKTLAYKEQFLFANLGNGRKIRHTRCPTLWGCLLAGHVGSRCPPGATCLNKATLKRSQWGVTSRAGGHVCFENLCSLSSAWPVEVLACLPGEWPLVCAARGPVLMLDNRVRLLQWDLPPALWSLGWGHRQPAVFPFISFTAPEWKSLEPLGPQHASGWPGSRLFS